MSIRILIADDHQIVRVGLCSVLAGQEGFEIVAQASNGLEAIKLAQETAPDVVLMDVSMPQMNGTEAVRQIKKDLPETKIIIISMYDRREFILDMLDAGVQGYILKTEAADDLIPAMKAALQGEIYLAPRIAAVVAKECVRRNKTPGDHVPTELSARERQVLQLIAEGKSSKEIGRMLSLEERTVVSHRQHIMDKVGIRSVAGLTKYAVRQGITSLE
jgi:two-component system, NarL family, response regulator NreC